MKMFSMLFLTYLFGAQMQDSHRRFMRLEARLVQEATAL
jgi:hypothetical protein